MGGGGGVIRCWGLGFRASGFIALGFGRLCQLKGVVSIENRKLYKVHRALMRDGVEFGIRASRLVSGLGLGGYRFKGLGLGSRE